MRKFELQYIGACAYLGRLYPKVPKDEQETIKYILDDFIDEYDNRFELIKTADGGYSLELKVDIYWSTNRENNFQV